MATATLSRQSVFWGYVALTKPRIIVLLVFTALAGMFLASRGVPDLQLTALVLGAGAMAAGGANALNHYLERDIDERMQRTRNRPVVLVSVQPTQALVSGIVLYFVASAVLSSSAPLFSSVLPFSAALFSVFVTSMST